MKKLKLFGLLAMMLVVATVLCACGNLANLNKIYNEAYDEDARQFTAATVIADLEDFEKVDGQVNGEFAIFSKEVDGQIAYKVYSFRKQAVVGTFQNNATTKVAPTVLGIPAFCVKSTTGEGKDAVVTYTYYNVEGGEIVKIDEKAVVTGIVKKVNDKLAIIDTVAYTIDEATGMMTKKADIPAYVNYEGIDAYNDEYFYEFINKEGNKSAVIYDIDFKPVAIWNAPSYAEGLDYFTLNNGAVLVQYQVKLDEDAKKFDFYAEGNKYDLVSLIINTKGNVKNVNLDYKVIKVNPNYALYDENLAAEDNKYTDKFENLATIVRIENQLIDTNAWNRDFVLMNNSGKAQQSYKLVDGQIAEPERIAADKFKVETVYGTAIVDNKGKVLFAATQDLVVYGGYIVINNRAIYDLSFELVYDLKANYATVIDAKGNTLFVKAGEKVEEKYEILAFVNGAKEATSIMKYDNTLTKNPEFKQHEVGYCIVTTGDDGKQTYTYYAPNGTELLKTTAAIEKVGVSTNKDVAVYSVKEVSAEGKEVTKYYAFTKAVAEAE